jgi:lipopolysaccharide export system protein LptA
MRRTRRLLLLLIAAIVTGVAISYSIQRDMQARNAVASPAVLPESVSAQAANWSYEKTDPEGGRPVVRVFAKGFRQLADGARVELEHVTLQMFKKDGKAFDEVKSAKADFDLATGQMFSDGEVEITMGFPSDNSKNAHLVHIKTSGLRFDSKTGSAVTDREAEFKFDRGEGKSVGARYDPATRELNMQSEVSLTWYGNHPGGKRMQVQGGSLVYKEAESKVVVTPWARFQRETLSVEAGNSIVTLVDGAIQHIEAFQARGTDAQPNREVDFSAQELRMQFNEEGAVKSLTGEKGARLVSTGSASQTTIDSKRVDLEFEAPGDESFLKKALATSGAMVEAKPLPRQDAMLPETRVMRSDVIALYMRDKAEEIDRIETESPGTVEFLPNRPGQKKRFLTGERLYLRYGARNQLRSFRAVTASTRTEPEPVAGKPSPPALTWSKDLAAEFDEHTGALQKMEQWDDFRYEEGERKAKADKATLTSAIDEIMLTGTARFWDPTGSTSADTIRMNQKTGDFSAVGSVNSTRMPEQKKRGQPGMLSNDEPVHAKAQRMFSEDQHSKIRYEGDALMWQAANRLQADRILIDRKEGNLVSDGNVLSQLLDKSQEKEKKAKEKKSAVFTIVKSPRMTYSDKERLAHYTGGSVLTRDTTVVTANEIRAFLKQGEESSLDRAVADGAVKIVQTSPLRKRTGVSEHAEYYVNDGLVILSGGAPELVDSVEGITRGRKLTYFSNNDRLLVEGAQGQPVESKLLRK